jgi:hypothetical protein
MKTFDLEAVVTDQVMVDTYEVVMKEYSRSLSIFSSQAITLKVPKERPRSHSVVTLKIDTRLPCDTLPSFAGRFVQSNYVASLTTPNQRTAGVLPLTVCSMHPLSNCPKCGRSLQVMTPRISPRIASYHMYVSPICRLTSSYVPYTYTAIHRLLDPFVIVKSVTCPVLSHIAC